MSLNETKFGQCTIDFNCYEEFDVICPRCSIVVMKARKKGKGREGSGCPNCKSSIPSLVRRIFSKVESDEHNELWCMKCHWSAGRISCPDCGTVIQKNSLVAIGAPYNPSTTCFVVTTCFGNENHPTVLAYRKFRDTFLAKYRSGMVFIFFYNRFGPFAARFIGKQESIKKVFRVILKIGSKFVDMIQCDSNNSTGDYRK